MLLHIDGSKHRWFCDDRYYDLLVILDDATSELYYAQLVQEESTRTVRSALREVIEHEGLFCALSSDRGSHFFVTRKAGEKVDPHRLTQVGRAMKELGVQMIPAYSPQARGRCERSFGTWQNRLPQELRLAGISTLEQANAFLRERYIAEFNRKFAKPAAEKGTAFRKCGRKDLDWVFSIQTERTVAQDNTIVLQNRYLQLDKTRFRNTLAGCTVTVCEHLDGSVSVRWGPHLLTTTKAERDGGKDGATGALEISPNPRDPTLPTVRRLRVHSNPRPKPKRPDRTDTVSIKPDRFKS
jgi:transposase InsO family protein